MKEQKEVEVLKKVEDYIASHNIDFTKEELKVLKEIAQREIGYQHIKKFGFLVGNRLKTFLTYLGLIITTYLLVKTSFIEWVRQGLSQ